MLYMLIYYMKPKICVYITFCHCVQVKPISYMMLNVDTVVKTDGGQITSIPVGAVLHFSVSYHDDVGAKFDAATARLKYRPNR